MTEKQKALIYTDKFGRIIIEDPNDNSAQLVFDPQADIITQQAEIIAGQEEAISELISRYNELDQKKSPPQLEGWLRTLPEKRHAKK